MEIRNEIAELLTEVKIKNPLVHHLTNYITANDCANIVLALGGSPVMADEEREVEEMVSIASALVINIGSLTTLTIKAMLKAGKKANKKGIPVILDPVGIGATSLRTNTVKEIVNEVKVSVIRGNMAEIKILAGLKANIKGVDSREEINSEGERIAVELARLYNCVIAVTGAKDIITDGKKVCIIENGHKMLSQVTGTGCMSTSLVGTYSGVTNDYYLSSIAGIVSMGLAGEKAYKSLKNGEGTGTFRVKIIDNISLLTEKDFREGSKVHEQ